MPPTVGFTEVSGLGCHIRGFTSAFSSQSKYYLFLLYYIIVLLFISTPLHYKYVVLQQNISLKKLNPTDGEK